MTLHLVGPGVDETLTRDELDMRLLDFPKGATITLTVED